MDDDEDEEEELPEFEDLVEGTVAELLDFVDNVNKKFEELEFHVDSKRCTARWSDLQNGFARMYIETDGKQN